MLEAIDLECQRGERLLFTGLRFAVAGGTCLHVAGPNGAGKTSLQRIVCGLLQPTAGEVRFKGENIRALREEYWQALAYVGHLNGVKDDLSAEENVFFAAGLAGRVAHRDEVRDALDKVGLKGFEAQLARHLSQGQKRRVALARLFLAASASVWVLDEPFTALDVRGVAALSALITAHLERDGVVVLTTHQDVPIAGRVEKLTLVPAAAPGFVPDTDEDSDTQDATP
ncbi:MAG: cytochrome c biogenesis heme-transporting ATPase CcmA [Burkholderiaceae bacterium]|nr:cytochrome c biogenesis heme-transporting ATPase CcmA [Burkholderiaceae bacterium]